MIKKGCLQKNITAAIGPCIASNNYEVKKDFIKKFIKKDKKNILFFKKIKKYFIVIIENIKLKKNANTDTKLKFSSLNLIIS